MSLRNVQTMHVSNMLARDRLDNFGRFGLSGLLEFTVYKFTCTL